MSEEPPRKDLNEFTGAITRALRRAAKTARKTARLSGTPLYVSRNGKIVAIKVRK